LIVVHMLKVPDVDGRKAIREICLRRAFGLVRELLANRMVVRSQSG